MGLRQRWSDENGYHRVLVISLPLVASMGSITVMQFTDRVFLANYSLESISAALPAGIASFMLVSFFMGVAGYVNAFVAQYTGAGRPGRVGASMWQGIYFAAFAGLILASVYFFARPIFDLIGHPAAVRDLEVIYFRIMILGSGVPVLSTALSAFFTGRGLSWTVMWAYLTGAVVNIPLDYALINGLGPFPEMGIRGAAVATVTASLVTALVLAWMIFRPINRQRFKLWTNRAFDRELFGRLMRFGLPSGIQFFLEISGFTFFIFMVGRLGETAMAASNIVLSIESLSFMPMVGFNIAAATLVGQAIGRGKPADGVYAITTTLHLTMAYMVPVALVFVLLPEPLLTIFRPRGTSPADFAAITALGVVLLRFVAAFNLFDTLNLVYSGALKGAGDTRFIMWAIAAIAVGMMIIPVYLAVEVYGMGVIATWTLGTAYVAALGLAFWLRYRSGNWQRMTVMEKPTV